MKKSKINYTEGTCFVVPLRDGGFARGIVCRMDGKGKIFGYFFGPRLREEKEAKIDGAFSPEHASLVGQFGDLGLIKGAWTILGRISDWNRDFWPLPVFVRTDSLNAKRRVVVRYSDELKWLSDENLPDGSSELADAPEDGLMGYGFVELRLTKLLPVL